MSDGTMIDPRFRRAEEEYQRLKGEVSRGAITPAQFEEALNGLVIESGGRYWMIGANSGRWYRSEGDSWVEAPPPRMALPESSSVRHVQVPPPPIAPHVQVVSPPAPGATHKALGCGIGCLVPILVVAAAMVLEKIVDEPLLGSLLGMLLIGFCAFLPTVIAVLLLRRAPLWIVALSAAAWIPVGVALMYLARNYWMHTMGYGVIPAGVGALVAIGLSGLIRLILKNARPV